jgi:hypothetical protein
MPMRCVSLDGTLILSRLKDGNAEPVMILAAGKWDVCYAASVLDVRGEFIPPV